MKSMTKVVALSAEANIYAVVDNEGNSLGTGTREVCEFLAQVASGAQHADYKTSQPRILSRSSNNIRSVITI